MVSLMRSVALPKRVAGRIVVLAVCAIALVFAVSALRVGWLSHFTEARACSSHTRPCRGPTLETYGLLSITTCDITWKGPTLLSGCASTSYGSHKILEFDPLRRALRGLSRAASLFSLGIVCCLVCGAVVAAPLRSPWTPKLPALAPALAACIFTAVGCVAANEEMRELEAAQVPSDPWMRSHATASGSGAAGNPGLAVGIGAALAAAALVPLAWRLDAAAAAPASAPAH